LDKKIVFPTLERAATASALAIGATSNPAAPNRVYFHDIFISSPPAPLWTRAVVFPTYEWTQAVMVSS
jgi:hypothetical protein